MKGEGLFEDYQNTLAISAGWIYALFIPFSDFDMIDCACCGSF